MITFNLLGGTPEKKAINKIGLNQTGKTLLFSHTKKAIYVFSNVTRGSSYWVSIIPEPGELSDIAGEAKSPLTDSATILVA